MTNTEAVGELKAKILAKRPILAGLFERYANTSVGEYNRILGPTAVAVDAVRKQDFIAAISAEVAGHFSSAVAASTARQLKEEYMVSTAEHHGPLTHPFFVHSNLLAASRPRKNIIVLAVGNVSLNNSSYPRGLIFHGADGAEHRLPFFPWRERMSAVFGQRAFDRRDLNRLDGALNYKIQSRELSAPAAAAVREFVHEVYGQPEILEQPDYNHQIVKTNDRLWKQFFVRSAFQPPRLLTLQLEDVVIKLLCRHHLFAQTEIYDLIFSPEVHELLKQHADGIPGNFQLKQGKGTFLFWHYSGNGRRQLWLKGGDLVSAEGDRVELRPQAIAAALESGRLIPGTFLSLLLLSEYYGVKCLGGFSQGTYLTRMHQAYNLMRGRPAEDFNREHSSGLRSDFVLGYFQDNLGRFQAASGLDLALHNHPKFWEIFSETIGKLTLEQAMAPLFPELYRALYSAAEQQPELSKITADDIINFYNLPDKIIPCINITL